MEFHSRGAKNHDHGSGSVASTHPTVAVESASQATAAVHRLSTHSATPVSAVGARCLELVGQLVALETRRMSHGTSGSTTGDGPVNVSLVEIGDLCFATKVNDKQIIFCTRQRRPCTETGVNSGHQDVRKGPGSVTGGSVPRQLSAGADRQPRAEVVASCSSGSGSSGGSSCSAAVVAVSVNRSGELVDSWFLADGKHWLRASDEAGSVDDSAATVAAQWSSRAGNLDRNDDPGPAVRLIFDDGGTIKRRTTKAGRGAQQQFEQFCVKCRVYLFEHFAKFRSNDGVMSRVSFTTQKKQVL